MKCLVLGFSPSISMKTSQIARLRLAPQQSQRLLLPIGRTTRHEISLDPFNWLFRLYRCLVVTVYWYLEGRHRANGWGAGGVLS